MKINDTTYSSNIFFEKSLDHTANNSLLVEESKSNIRNSTQLRNAFIEENISEDEYITARSHTNNSLFILNEDKSVSKCDTIKNILPNKPSKFIAGAVLGLGTGIAMMPIFNDDVYNLDEYGIDVHGNDFLFTISTINTLIVTTMCNTVDMYKYFTKESLPEIPSPSQKALLTIGKITAAAEAIIPTALLWNVELRDSDKDDSHGFDKFILWATCATLPLLIVSAINNYRQIKSAITYEDQVPLDSLGSKIAVYTIDALSSLARGLSFTAVTKELCFNLGFNEEASNAIGIILGGILINSISALSDHANLKSLFKKQEEPFKKAALGTFSTIEGMWFSLPAITAGLEYTKEWNTLLKGAIFVPYFVNKTAKEACGIYDTFEKQKVNTNMDVIL